MANKLNTFEGIASGTAVTTANSGGASGDAFNLVGGSVFAQSSAAIHDARGIVATLAAGTESYVGWNTTGSVHYVRMYFTTDAGATTHNKRMVWSGTAASTTAGWDIRQIVGTERVGIAVRNTTRFELGPSGNATGILARNTSYRVEAFITLTGITARLYDMAGTLLDTNTYTAAITATSDVKFGVGNGTAVNSSMAFDSIGYSDTAWLGPHVSSVAPVAEAGPNQTVWVNSSVSLNGSASTGTGTLTYAWTQLSGTSVSLSSASATNPSFTSPSSPSTLVFQLTITDGNAVTATDTVTITVQGPVSRINNFEGIASGTAITTANSGGTSGNAFDEVVGSVLSQSSSALKGLRGMFASITGSTDSYVAWNTSGTVHYVRAYFKTDSSETTHNKRMIWSGTVASATNGWDVRQIVGSERIGIATRNTTRFELGPSGSGAGTLARNTTYRVEAYIVTGSSGTIQARLYDANGTLLDSNTFNGTVDAITQVKFGVGNGTAVTSSISLDSIAYGQDEWLGPAENEAPSANAGVDQTVEPWTLVTIYGGGSDPDGTVASYAWSQSSGTTVTLSGTGPNRTFTSPASLTQQTLVFSLIVTDNIGTPSSPDTVTITVMPVTERAVIGGVEVPAKLMSVS